MSSSRSILAPITNISVRRELSSSSSSSVLRKNPKGPWSFGTLPGIEGRVYTSAGRSPTGDSEMTGSCMSSCDIQSSCCWLKSLLSSDVSWSSSILATFATIETEREGIKVGGGDHFSGRSGQRAYTSPSLIAIHRVIEDQPPELL